MQNYICFTVSDNQESTSLRPHPGLRSEPQGRSRLPTRTFTEFCTVKQCMHSSSQYSIRYPTSLSPLNQCRIEFSFLNSHLHLLIHWKFSERVTFWSCVMIYRIRLCSFAIILFCSRLSTLFYLLTKESVWFTQVLKEPSIPDSVLYNTVHLLDLALTLPSPETCRKVLRMYYLKSISICTCTGMSNNMNLYIDIDFEIWINFDISSKN